MVLHVQADSLYGVLVIVACVFHESRTEKQRFAGNIFEKDEENSFLDNGNQCRKGTGEPEV